jgi:hypothetical protein
MNPLFCYQSDLRITFLNNIQAENVKLCMEVDDEIQPNKIEKFFSVESNVLIVKFGSSDIKVLRVGMSSFFDMVIVCTKTLLEFDSIEN